MFVNLKINLKYFIGIFAGFIFVIGFLALAPRAQAALSITSGNNATTTPSVATAITGFQIVGPSASTTPVKLHTTSGTIHLSVTSGVTMSGNDSTTVNLSGTVADLNNALTTLQYTRSSTGTDTLEVALVNSNQIYFPDNGHVYQFVSGSYTWSAANTAASGLTAYGVSGYLVTITSSAENSFVKDRLSGDAWIGASDSGVEGTWKWVTGPENGTTFWQGLFNGSTVGGNYASWASGEPNQSGDEDCAETYIANGNWNDWSCGNSTSYVAEFGAPGNLPVVVSATVSIVTADVPAVTSLSPVNGATGVSILPSLVIGFSKSVTKDSGNISIYKTSDNTLVQDIAVSGSSVTGSGSSSITITPPASLTDSTGYYIIVPNTAFKDSSNNYFSGISASSTWAFTTGDFTGPTFSSIVATSTASTTASVTWTTNELSSSKVAYGPTSSYSTSTSETDTSPRVTSHSVSLSSLLGCTLYHYAVISKDASSNNATSTDSTFTTVGCVASSTPVSATSTNITSSSGGTTSLTQTGKTFTVSPPANSTATSSSFVIQIQSLPSTAVLGVIGRPTDSPNEVGSSVFDVKAIINGSTILDSFDYAVTISYEYTDDEISGLDESSLQLYHYHNNIWTALNNCSVNAAANTISCTASSFSVFALFGQQRTVVTNTSSGIGVNSEFLKKPDMSKIYFTINNEASQTFSPNVTLHVTTGGDVKSMAVSATPGFEGVSIEQFSPLRPWVLCGPCQNGENYTVYVKLYTAYGQSVGLSANIVYSGSKAAAPAAPVSPKMFLKNLRLGMTDPDVVRLQQYLNSHGFVVAISGPGSLGHETSKFGALTKQAVMALQAAHPEEILFPVGLKSPSGIFAESTRQYVNGH